MSEIAKIVGTRLRLRRQELGYSQELTAEKAGLHPTYIGQVERGEKNATIGSVEKICIALEYPMDELFLNITPGNPEEYHARKCFDLIVEQPLKDQEALQVLIQDVISYKQK